MADGELGRVGHGRVESHHGGHAADEVAVGDRGWREVHYARKGAVKLVRYFDFSLDGWRGGWGPQQS